ncbi:MFS transporter [Streptomyces sp. NPDC004327]|uniref:MFS transporter n=1 Tax=Streptomyces sp. NPDC004327 TaxID=3364699 RepID=UPI0036CE3098
MDQLTAEDPTRIGPYRLIARLGAGGMGLVYLGRSEAGRTVAVKVVQAEYAGNPEFRRRFAREVAAARLVGGAWTAAVLDADPEAAVPWVATQYIAGPDLHSVVAEDFGPLPEPSVRALANRLALALGAVHAAGLIHRDLKPSNVLVTVDGPRVIDFGIARAMDSLAGDSLHTHTGMLIGSPGFMSPEQVRGLELTPASDVFCLGAVLVYAATGRHLFGATDTGLNAHLFRVAEEEPDLTGVPESLLDLVRACLAKDPAARPTPREVAERTAAQLPAEWLPDSVLAQLGRHAAQLLDFAPPVPPGVPAQPDPRLALAQQQPVPAVPPPPAYAPTAPGYGAAAYAPTAPAYGAAPGAGWQPYDAEPPYPRRWWALTVACFVTFLVPFEATLLNMAFPSIQSDLGLASGGMNLIFSVYAVVLAGLLLLGGHLADLAGRKAILVVGLAGFMVASVLTGAAVGEGMLIAARGLQGASAALLSPAALSLVVAAFPDGRPRRTAFGVYGAVVGTGALVGSFTGGTFLELASWRLAEYVGVPLGVLALVGVFTLAPERPAPGGGARLDLPGLLLGSLGLAVLVYGVEGVASNGWTDVLALILAVAGVALLAGFLWLQTSSSVSLVPAQVLKDPRHAGALGALLLLGVGLPVMYTALLFRLQAEFDNTPMQAGLMVLPAVATQVVAATAVASRVRATQGVLAASGAVLTAVAIALFAALPMGSDLFVLPVLLLLGFGIGLALVPLYAAATEDVPRAHAGGAAGAAVGAAQVGSSLGAAVTGAVLAASFAGLTENEAASGVISRVIDAHTTSLWCAVGAVLLGALIGGLTLGGSRTPSGSAAAGGPGGLPTGR